MSRARVLSWAAVLMLALVVAACSRAPQPGQQPQSGQQPSGGQQGCKVRIGTSLPLTGQFTEPGKAAKEGYEIWRDLINQKGGLVGCQVELVIYDDASDADTVVADYERLINVDKVDLLLGTYSTKLNYPASAIAEKYRMLFVEPAGGAPKMFQRGFKFLFFTQQAVADTQGRYFWEWVLSLPAGERPKTAAYVTQDDPFAKPNVEGIKAALEAGGIQTVYGLEIYPPETTNFVTLANAVKAKNPDILIQGSVFEDGVGMVRALRQVGFNPKILFQTTAPSLGEQYANAVGREATEGIFTAISHHPAANTPGNAEFVQAYKARFGYEPPEDAADAYAAGQVLQAAVEAVGSWKDQQKLAEWLHSNCVQTILDPKPLCWDEAGRPLLAFMIAQWQGGHIEIVLPEGARTTDKIVYPKPDWPK